MQGTKDLFMDKFNQEIAWKDLSQSVAQLAVDMVQNAQSGHPGMPMGFSRVATVLWYAFLRTDPSDPQWKNRDRFILSNGHGCALQYALLHLTGYPLSLDECRSFRQLNSPTAGHPEYDVDIGIETTTGPLGQGLANACGIALAQKHINARCGDVLDFKTYVVVGDGCLMEGVSHEAANCASVWGLNDLIVLWDDNDISIDGKVSLATKEDTLARFRSYGWHVIGPIDGDDFEAIHAALTEAQSVKDKPVFIDFKTTIGNGAGVLAGSEKTHGSPLPDDIYKTFLAGKKPFHIDASVQALWRDRVKADKASFAQRIEALSDEKRALFSQLGQSYVADQDGLMQWLKTADLVKPQATRQASKEVLGVIGPKIPWLMGGSADLGNSVLTNWGGGVFSKDAPSGRQLHYGVREFAMFAVANGLALSGVRPYVGTFLVFIDYARNALRLAGLMQLPVVYVLTHDSIGIGEDGPTHQPVEHLTILRSTPGLETWRPANLYETAIAWQEALSRKGPTAIVLTRQKCFASSENNQTIKLGGRIVSDCDNPQCVVIATGSEVGLCEKAMQLLEPGECRIRLISVPCLSRFMQSKEKLDWLKDYPLFVVEAASDISWGQLQPDPKMRLTVNEFGLSGKGEEVMSAFGFSPENVAMRMRQICKASTS